MRLADGKYSINGITNSFHRDTSEQDRSQPYPDPSPSSRTVGETISMDPRFSRKRYDVPNWSVQHENIFWSCDVDMQAIGPIWRCGVEFNCRTTASPLHHSWRIALQVEPANVAATHATRGLQSLSALAKVDATEAPTLLNRE